MEKIKELKDREIVKINGEYFVVKFITIQHHTGSPITRGYLTKLSRGDAIRMLEKALPTKERKR